MSHDGRYFQVDNARIYSLPDEPPPIVVSAFGKEAATLAADVADGFVTVAPDDNLLGAYRDQGGRGPAVGALKMCWDRDESRARRTAHELWATELLPGQLNQELPLPRHFESAIELVSEEMVAQRISCGPDPERHADAIRQYLEAGFDEVYVNQIGEDWDGFLDFFQRELRPRLRQ